MEWKNHCSTQEDVAALRSEVGGATPADAITIRDRVKAFRRVKASTLLPHPANWRRHNGAQADALRSLLAEIGFAGVILAFETSNGLMVIDGHLRAETLADAEVPVVVLDVDEDEAEKLLATYDPLSAMAETDGTRLKDLLARVRSDSEPLKAMLDRLREQASRSIFPAQGKTDPDAVPELPDEPLTRRGDLIVLGDHRLVCGDSTVSIEVEVALGGVKPSMVFADPPFGIAYQSRVDKGIRKDWGPIANDDLSGDALVRLLTAAVPPIEPRYVCACWDTFPEFHRALGPPRSVVVWDKIAVGLGCGYRRQHEIILFYGAFDSTTESDVWRIPREGGFGGSYVHPTQKPVKLVERALGNSSVLGDVVYDPFLGSGTTLIACERLGRRCVGVEFEPKYCDVIVRRWEDFTGRKAVRTRPSAFRAA